ncbi:MAG: hypothetical protein WBD22_13715 [Pyrinomonadaceae bacterium]
MINSIAFKLTAIVFVGLISVTAHSQTCPFLPGCLDPTFGTGGKVTYQFSPSLGAPVDIVILPDGKILELVYGNRFVRLNADGTLDQTFGSGGVATFVWPATPGGYAVYANGYAMRLQDVGGGQRVVVAGTRRIPSGRKFVDVLQIGRYMPDGSIDTLFGTNGTEMIMAATFANEMEIQADGKIVILDGTGKVVRTNANGSLDTGFGSGGFVNTGLRDDVAIDGAGGILVGGEITTGKGTNSKMLLAVKRYTSSGAADTAFGMAGTAMADFSARHADFGRLAIDAFGNIVAAGGVVAPGYGQYYFAAARFTSSGLADISFGGTGQVKFVGASGTGDRGVLIQDDGKVVLTGQLNADYGLVRYNHDGTLDATFGNGGSVIEDVDLTDQVKTWAIQMDPGCACSKIVMSSYGNGLSFARFTVQ